MLKARTERGTLIASGFIAGGALFGVFSAITVMCGVPLPQGGDELTPQILGLLAYAAIIGFIYVASVRAKK